jgi:hypothetical protein
VVWLLLEISPNVSYIIEPPEILSPSRVNDVLGLWATDRLFELRV